MIRNRTQEQIVIVQSIKNPRVTRRMTTTSARLNKSNWKVIRIDTETPKVGGIVKICICTAVWKRPEVFKMFAQGIKLLQSDQVELTVIVAGSEGMISRKLVESEGFVYVEIPNTPLSNKHNAAVRKAKEFNPHCVILTGSDDILSQEAFEVYLEKIRDGYDFIGVTDFYFYDLKSKKSSYWGGYQDKSRKGHTCGAFRCFSSRLMNIWGWAPFEAKHSHVLDNSTQIKLGNIKHKSFIFSLKQYNVLGVDIKSDTNMTPFKLWDNTKYIDNAILKSKFDYLWT